MCPLVFPPRPNHPPPLLRPTTGEPYAGKPPVRFVGRGGPKGSFLPLSENGKTPVGSWILPLLSTRINKSAASGAGGLDGGGEEFWTGPDCHAGAGAGDGATFGLLCVNDSVFQPHFPGSPIFGIHIPISTIDLQTEACIGCAQQATCRIARILGIFPIPGSPKTIFAGQLGFHQQIPRYSIPFRPAFSTHLEHGIVCIEKKLQFTRIEFCLNDAITQGIEERCFSVHFEKNCTLSRYRKTQR